MSTESIESIASRPAPLAAGSTCASCGAPLAGDQRYCLQCGERSPAMSSVLAGTPLQAGPATPPGAPLPPGAAPPGIPGAPGEEGRNNALTVIAGVGVLLLAMGVGVLIGRSTSSKPSAASNAPQVITVGSSAAGASPTSAEAFTGDWPAGATGYTVQLESLPTASTQVSSVQAAKSAAEGKGAKQVGALKSDEFSGMTPGSYIVYSGRYAKKAEAQKALSGLKRNFPSATVLQVGSGAGSAAGAGKGSGAASGGSGAAKGGVGSSINHPAPPSVLNELHKSKGKSYEEKSKNLPDVVETG